MNEIIDIFKKINDKNNFDNVFKQDFEELQDILYDIHSFIRGELLINKIGLDNDSKKDEISYRIMKELFESGLFKNNKLILINWNTYKNLNFKRFFNVVGE